MKKIEKSLINTVFIVGLFFVLNSSMQSGLIDGYYSGIIMIVCINIILAVSLNLITGFTGQLCLGHAGFMAIGAYSSVIITAKLNYPFYISLIVAGIAAAIIALVVGIPTLKLKGDYFAITTLGIGEVIRGVLVNIDYVGGARGMSVPLKTTFAWSFFIMIATIVIVYNVIHSAQGRNMVAIRENEIAAEAMGVNTSKYKIMALIISAFFAGVAGALYAHYNGFIDPPTFNFLKSVEILTFVVLGGMGSLTGTIIATIILTFLPELFREFQGLRMIIYSLSLIILMIFRPQGLMGTKEFSYSYITKLFKKKKATEEGK